MGEKKLLNCPYKQYKLTWTGKWRQVQVCECGSLETTNEEKEGQQHASHDKSREAEAAVSSLIAAARPCRLWMPVRQLSEPRLGLRWSDDDESQTDEL